MQTYELSKDDLFVIEMVLRQHPYYDRKEAIDILRRVGVPVPADIAFARQRQKEKEKGSGALD